MFGDISLWTWMGGAIVFALGGGAGYMIARQIKDERTRQLEQQLEQARQEMDSYRGDVNQHFLKTSLLLSKLTDNYREVYEHLATGAQRLCKDKPHTPELKLSSETILPAAAGLSLDHAAEENLGAETTTATHQLAENAHQDEIAIEEPMEEPAESGAEKDVEKSAAAEYPTPPSPDSLQTEAEDEDVHLGEESAPGIDLKHGTHPAIH